MKKVMLLMLATGALMAASTASFAHGYYGHGYYGHGYYGHGYYGPRVVIGIPWGPPPVYYAPPPVVYVAPSPPQNYIKGPQPTHITADVRQVTTRRWRVVLTAG